MLQSAHVDQSHAEGSSPGRHVVKSLGGCLTKSVMRTCRLHTGVQHRHFWRRPTLALMARSLGDVPEWPDYLVPFLMEYMAQDIRKDHLRQLMDGPCDVLVFDITRDVLQGVMDFGDDMMIADPLSLRGNSYDAERPDRTDLDQIFGSNYKIRTYEDEDFFGLYEHFFDLFAASAGRFERVIINRIYYTDLIASKTDESFGDSALVRRVNRFLDRAYHHIERYYPEIAWNSVDARFMLSADTAPYGLFHTHYIPEAVGILADGIASLTLGRRYRPGRVFQDAALASALDRLDHSREIQRQLAAAEAARDERSAAADALRGERDAALAEADRLRAEQDERADEAARRFTDLEAARDAAVQGRAQDAAETEALRRDLEAARADADQLRAQRDAQAAEAERQARERTSIESDLARVRAQLDEYRTEPEAPAARLDAIAAEPVPHRDMPEAGTGDRDEPADRAA